MEVDNVSSNLKRSEVVKASRGCSGLESIDREDLALFIETNATCGEYLQSSICMTSLKLFSHSFISRIRSLVLPCDTTFNISRFPLI